MINTYLFYKEAMKSFIETDYTKRAKIFLEIEYSWRI